MSPRFSWITSIAPAGVSAVARNPCSSPVGPGKVIASPGVEAAGDPDAAAVAEAPAGADDPSTGRVAAGLGEICAAQAASRADADDAVMPSRINRRTASRRVIRPSTQSSPTSVVRYSRSAMGPPRPATSGKPIVTVRYAPPPTPVLGTVAGLGVRWVSSWSWRSSSVVEQGTHKPLVGGSNPPSATRHDSNRPVGRTGGPFAWACGRCAIVSNPSSSAAPPSGRARRPYPCGRQDLCHKAVTALDAILGTIGDARSSLTRPGGSF